MKKTGLTLLLLLLSACVSINYSLAPEFTSKAVIDKVDAHTVSIAVYYFMSQDELNRRLQDKKNSWFIMGKDAEKFWMQIIMPVTVPPQGGPDVKALAYIGSGTIIKNNHVLSVRHLFEHDANTYGMAIWVFKKGLDHAISADIVVLGTPEVSHEDYAVIKLKEDLKLPGLKVAERDSLKKGDPVIFTGSVGGMAFFTRFGYVTDFECYFRTDEDQRLRLSYYEDFPFWTVFPGGPGDSGGSVKNVNGEIVTLMYCGINVYDENYVFGNPTAFLWDFLAKNKLEHLVK